MAEQRYPRKTLIGRLEAHRAARVRVGEHRIQRVVGLLTVGEHEHERRGDERTTLAAADQIAALQRRLGERRALGRRSAADRPTGARRSRRAASLPGPGGSGSRRWRGEALGRDRLAGAEQRRGQLDRLQRGQQELGLPVAARPRRARASATASSARRLIKSPRASCSVAAPRAIGSSVSSSASRRCSFASWSAAASPRSPSASSTCARRSLGRRLGERAGQIRRGAGGRARALRGVCRLREDVDHPRLAARGACRSWVATGTGRRPRGRAAAGRRARARARARAPGCPRRRPRG